MRQLLAVLLALHGAAHLVGFRAAFWPATRPEQRLRRDVSKLDGGLWLLLALGFFVTATLVLVRSEYWLSVMLVTAGASFVMSLRAGRDARIGVVIDALVLSLAGLLVSQRGSGPRATFESQVERLPAPTVGGEVVDEASIAPLPEPVRRYLRFMGAVGRPRDTSVRARFSARFRRDAGAWLPCEVWQYDARSPVTRVFTMQVWLDGMLPVTVRDTYLNGRGTMEGKAFDRFVVAEGKGYELDLGELVTYLNDAILMAPSLLLGSETTWTPVDARSFGVTLRDGALSVSARVRVDSGGAPVSFSTTDRFFDTADGRRVRTEWRTPVLGWQEHAGRKLPTRAQAVWHLPTGPLVYADFDFEPSRIAFNVPPLPLPRE